MENHLKAATIVAHLLDNQFQMFGVRFGFAAVFELIPEAGDMIAFILSLYLIWIAVQMKLPLFRIVQMLINILINFFIGMVPVVGDTIYIFHKANLKNLQILRQYSREQVIEGEVVS